LAINNASNVTSPIFGEDYVNPLFNFGEVGLAKSIIFRSIARSSLIEKDYIPAVITGYYSLFHLALGLIYFFPHYVHNNKINEKLKKIADEGTDESGNISHKEVLKFLKECQNCGLPGKCYLWLKKGKNLREYINYAPRLRIINDYRHLINDYSHFNTCKYNIDDFEEFIEGCDDVIIQCINWGFEQQPSNFAEITIALSRCIQFLNKPELGYINWIKRETRENAAEFISTLQKRH